MHRPRRIGAKITGSHKDHARGAKRQQRIAIGHRAHAHRARRIITAARRHRHAGHAPKRGHFCPQMASHFAAFIKARHGIAGEAGCRQHVVRPVTPGYIQPQCACAVGHVAGLVAGQAQADIILGQQHGFDLREDVRLMVPQPLQLGRGKPRHCDIASNLPRLRHGGFNLGAFGKAAAIVPQDRGTQGPVIRAQHCCPMHLPGKTYPQHLRPQHCIQPQHGSLGSAPPVVRLLLRPQGLRARHVEGHAGLAQHHANR